MLSDDACRHSLYANTQSEDRARKEIRENTLDESSISSSSGMVVRLRKYTSLRARGGGGILLFIILEGARAGICTGAAAGSHTVYIVR